MANASLHKRTQLTNIEVEKIGCVDRPAIRRRFFLLKGEQVDPAKLIEEIAAVEVDTVKVDEVCKSAKLAEDATAAVTIAAKALLAHADTVTPEVIGNIAKALGYVEPQKAEEKPVDKNENQPAMTDEMRAEIEKRDAEMAELRKSLDAERDARVTRDYIEKAAKLQVPGFTAQTLGPVLKSIDASMSAEQAKALHQHFAMVSEMSRKSDLFKAIGTTGSDAEMTREDRIEKRAVELAKANGKTKEQNYAQAMREVKE